MVELFTVGFFGRTPSVIIRPVAYVTAHKLPTAAEVERTCKPINGSGPNPLAGLVGTFQHHPFEHHGRAIVDPVFPDRPTSDVTLGMNGIETAD